MDYVRLLREHNDIPSTLYVRVTGDRLFEALVPFRGTRCAYYRFGKNPNDDFILFREGSVSDLLPVSPAFGAQRYSAIRRFDVLQPWSNKEYAICVAPVGSGFPHQWLPEHSQIGTIQAVRQDVHFDDTIVMDWTPGDALHAVKSVRIEQHLLGIHPNDPASPVAEIRCSHTVDQSGVTVSTRIEWLRPVSITAGYGMMLPVVRSFADQLVTGKGRTYEATAADGSRSNLIDGEYERSYAFTRSTEHPDGRHRVAAAMTIKTLSATTSQHGYDWNGNASPYVWLEHRNELMQKLYPQVYKASTAQPGDIFKASGVYFIGEIPRELMRADLCQYRRFT